MKYSLSKEILVWILILVSVVIFFGFVWTISSKEGRFLGAYVIYKAQFEEASGLNVGTKVKIHGQRTGNILKMELLPSGLIEVSFSIKKDHKFIMNESSWTELKNSGALGDRFLNIVTKDLSAPQVPPQSIIPYKKSSNLLSLFTDSKNKKPQQSLQNIMDQIDKALTGINENGLVNILSEQDKKELSEILKNTNQILKKISDGEGSLGALIQDKKLYNRLLILLGERPQNNYLEDLSKKKK